MDNVRLRFSAVHLGRRGVALLLVTIALLAVLAAAGPVLLTGRAAGTGEVPPAHNPDWTPSYSLDVEPIFARDCVRCHGESRADKGLRLDSYQRMMAGDSYGTVVLPGDSSLSAIISVVKYGNMPHDATRLTTAEIETISRWIDAGAPGP